MKKEALLIVVGMLLLVTMACGLPGGIGGDGEEDTGGNGGAQPPSGDEGDFQTAELEQLSSYRLEMTWRVEPEDGSEPVEMTFLQEWTSDPLAQHIVMSGSEGDAAGMPFAEIITVEDISWVLAGDTWMEVPGAEDMVPTDMWEGFFGDFEDWEYEGRETVNGVNCKYYTSSGEDTFTVPDPQGGGTVSVDAEAEVWVADESDLPPVVVRQRARIEGGFLPFPTADAGAEGGTVYLETDLTEINGDISIEPPDTP